MGKKKRPRKVHTFYGSERQAKNKTQELITYHDNRVKQEYIPNDVDYVDTTKITFKEYAEEWIEINFNKGELERRTIEGYAGIAKKHIFPHLGHVTLKNISPYHIAKYKEIKLKSLSPVTVNKHLSFISDVLADAASPEKKLIPFNCAVLVSRAKGGDKGKKAAMINCLNVNELNDLLYKLETLYFFRRKEQSIKKDPEVIKKLKSSGFTDEEIASPKAFFKFKVTMLYPITYIVARTGMRLSEVLALQWNDINFHERIIRVHSSSHFGIKKDNEQSAHHINSTKEGKPKAYIDITKEDVEFLKNFKKEQLKRRLLYRRSEYIDNNLVFCNNSGTYLINNTVSRVFSGFAKSIGLNITFHGLRHTHCTLLLANGVPDMYVARRVGHQNATTTNKIYSHVEKGGSKELGTIFQEILKKAEDFASEQLLKVGQRAHEITK